MRSREATGTLSVEAVRVLALGAMGAGLTPPALCARVGLDPAVLGDVDARVPVASVVRLWDELPALVGDDAFGLHLAERAVAAPLGLGGQLIVASATLGEGLRRILAFERVFHDVRQSELVVDGDRAAIRHDPGGLRMPRHAIEFAWAWLVLLARRVTGAPIQPLAVRFAHPAPGSLDEHRRIFGVTPRFAAPVPELTVARGDLDRPSAGADPALGAILDSHARLLASRLPTSPALRDQTRSALEDAMRAGDPGVAAVARRLGLAPRTLQRRLRAEGTSVAALLDEVRRDTARRWLADPTVSVAEVAFGLGFAEVSAFHRAFVRWTGVTPGRFRRSPPA